MGKKLSHDDWVVKATQKHNGKYSYENTIYVNARTPIIITCPEHGDFTQNPSSHVTGKGCKDCANEALLTTHDDWIVKANKKHNNKFDYSLVTDVKATNTLTIICPTHGKFTQNSGQHLIHGCKDCALDKTAEKAFMSDDELITKFKEVHGDTYTYGDLHRSNQKVTVHCKHHGDFRLYYYDHIRGSGCVNCIKKQSLKEKELVEYISSLGVKVETSNRTLIHPMEVDIILPELNIAFEFNGIYYHSDAFKHTNYHADKTNKMKAVGYRLIHIFEDDWNEHKDKIKAFITNILSTSENVVYARKTTLKEIKSADAKEFLNKHHIQGFGKATYHVGLYYDDVLTAVGSFKKAPSNTKNKGLYELVRYATKIPVIGGLGKVSKYVKNTYGNIYTFCDISMFTGQSYIHAGYQEVSVIKPDYKYVIGNKREHKFNWRVDKIYKLHPECKSMSEREAMVHLKHRRIYDCGKVRYEY